MTNQRKGHVEFRQPKVKLDAEMADDKEMRENTEEMKMNDGYQGSCGAIEDENKS